MKECTETDKPLISILLATYNPRINWLREQLDSLERQSHRPMELLVLDDCSSKVSLEAIRKCVGDCIKSIPFQILQNEKNLGSTKTFEKLTLLASGEYIAYCDQDDIWHGDKIETCLNKLMKELGVFAFSDMVIINDKGEKIANSITKVRRHHKFYSGTGLGHRLLFSNFVTGCTVLIKSEKAKEAVPFCPYMVHDHWLALFCSIDERLSFIEEPLLDYRIHENNQTLMMAGIEGKSSYKRIRIEEALNKFLWLKAHFKKSPNLSLAISQAIDWMEARKDHFNGSFKSVRTIWSYREFSYVTSIFEIFAPYLPEKLFLFIIGLKKKNLL